MGRGVARVIGGSGGSISGVSFLTKLLALPTTSVTTAAPAADGQILLVQITQSSAGDDQITWDTAVFAGTPPVNINPKISSITKFIFIGQSGFWNCWGMFIP